MSKRLFDLVVVIPALVLLFPVFLLIAVIIKWNSKGAIFFNHERVGLAGQHFFVHKFRTMVNNAHLKGHSITVGDDKRITSVGQTLRRYKLDELPQLWNVLTGSMSLVGPRPEVPEYVKLYSENQKQKILSVVPGITDLASVKYINESEILERSKNPMLTYVNDILPEKLYYAERYVDTQSVWLDITIILMTLKKIVS
jgi:lipopolysaccharide/colanic/teichoic acid biosynthesis glycosyltransferase